MDLKPHQKFMLAGVEVTVSESGNELVIDDQAFIQQLLAIGFRLGRNDDPERISEILRHVPAEYRQSFLAGVAGR